MTEEEIQDLEKIMPKDAGRLELLRAPFPPHQISKLPKRTCDKEEWDRLPKGRCAECGGWHATSKTIHLDYVGHAALTDRLLDVDPEWNWEPLAYDASGLPLFDNTGGLWIKLTVCGVTRLGYGHAATNKWADPGAREKEVIGDGLRNAAMRGGAALGLWHKGELHAENGEKPAPVREEPTDPEIVKRLETSLSLSELQHEFGKLSAEQRRVHAYVKDVVKAELTAKRNDPAL